jgi:hypothetical protein
MKPITTEKEYEDKYQFYYNLKNKTIVCTALYKNQTVCGVAKCSPEDAFDVNTGKKLAYLRCKQRLMHKKSKHAHKVYDNALDEAAIATDKLHRAAEFVKDVDSQLGLITDELINFECELSV